ncbi:putative Ty1-copia-like retrotransposon [Cucumis melo var. makuwa]|uniref:Ty1-copia-like retrotransposon n=1 Tax=Cucumis melo var. makuwa TaxID=1194695 RepID=A0A5D3CRZ7_CUCMM|nr:putative Ty1-copia-like retrotransposon [Cucumis melo var. makuwa]TYK14162.1 putative Ty1-copia-like retrotransposon [Cucumis melo var. makuwa]
MSTLSDSFILGDDILTALEAYVLESYFDSTAEPATKYINQPPNQSSVAVESSSAPPISVLNSEYKVWKRQDRLISSWLLGSMSEDILNQMLHFTSAKQIWKTLQGIYSSRYLAKAMQFKNKLHNMKKGAMSLKEYFLKIQQCVDALASINKPISTDDHILYILAGLGNEYQSIISIISARTDSPSVQDNMSLLLTQESQIESKITSEVSLPTVNMTTHTRDISSLEKESEVTHRGGSNNLCYTTTNSQYHHKSRAGGRSNRGGRGNRHKTQCQICSKFGHVADRCYFRYTPRNPPSGYSTNSSNAFPYAILLIIHKWVRWLPSVI